METISYLVDEKSLRVRYPANSCSRSGAIIYLKKLPD
jgi:hypothetical protein